MSQEPDLQTNPQPSLIKRIPWKEKLFILLILILILLVLASLFVRYKQHLKDSVFPYKPVAAVHSFSYKSLVDQTLKGAGDSLEFKRPAELEKVSETKNPAGIDFAKFSGPDRMLPYISYLSATSLTDKNSNIKSDQLEKGLASASDPSRQKAMQALSDYINLHKMGYYNAPVISDPQPFVVRGGKAWAVDFTLTANTITPKIDRPVNTPLAQSVKDTPTLKSPAYKGKIMAVLGRSSIYYFMVYDLSGNWQSNQSVWDQIVNSLRVDQQ